MADTSNGLTVVEHAVERGGLGLYIKNADIGSIAAGSLVSVKYLRDGNYANNTFRSSGTHIWRPSNATGVADDWRSAGDLTASTGSLAIDANWADTTLGTEDIILLAHHNHYDWLIAAMNRALRRAYFQSEEPFSWAVDAGFQSSATSDWTASSSTFTKISTANSLNVFAPYIRSGRSANSGANGYLTQEFATARGAEWFSGVLARVDVGTFELVWRDVTNSADLGTAITTTEETWVYVERRESVTSGASGTEMVGFRLQGDGASDDIYYNAAWFYPTAAHTYRLSTTWDSSSKTPNLVYLTFDKQLADHVWDAHSMRKHLIPPDAYRFLRTRPGANPYAIQWLDNSYLRYPVMIEGRRAHSDVEGPFTRVLTETTSADLDLFVWLTLEEFFLDARVSHPEKKAMLALAQDRVKGLSPQFSYEAPVRISTPSDFGRLRN